MASYFDLRPDAPDAWDANARTSLSIEIRASWQLDRLLFDQREVAATEAARRETNARRLLATQVIELFYCWRKLRARVQTPLSPGANADASSWTLELARTEALLQHLTGGRFGSLEPFSGAEAQASDRIVPDERELEQCR